MFTGELMTRNNYFLNLNCLKTKLLINNSVEISGDEFQRKFRASSNLRSLRQTKIEIDKFKNN